jgi:hypothetical protein
LDKNDIIPQFLIIGMGVVVKSVEIEYSDRRVTIYEVKKAKHV